jgi:hypothetical protein
VANAGNASLSVFSPAYNGVAGWADSLVINALTLSGGIQLAIDGATKVQLTNNGDFLSLAGQGWGVVSTNTAKATTTLTVGSPTVQIFTGSSFQTVQLPAANIYGAGVAVIYVIKNRSTDILTVQRAGSDLIDGSTTLTINTDDSVTLASDGVSLWTII